jgi:hypothetical protein
MPLPDFLVAGAMKAGTTTLWAMLNQHPEVYVTRPKELHYFDQHFDRGIAWYAEQFTPGASERMIGEATPIYMTDPVYHQRMFETVPHARLLITLREPSSRAYSHYWMMRAKGSEEFETFEGGLAAEDARWEASERLRMKWRFAYRRRGYYAEQLRGLETVYGRDRMHVLIFEEFIKAPRDSMRGVFDFLGIDSAVADTVELEHRKSSRGGRKAKQGYPPMSPETRARLREDFAPHHADLQAWLGREVTAWGS